MKKMKINYDKHNDILYISFGKPRPSFVEENEDGILLRYDMETEELTGITVIDFSKHTDDLKELNLPFELDFRKVESLSLGELH